MKEKKRDDHELEKLLNKVISENEVIRGGQLKSAVNAVAHIRENKYANNPGSEMECRTEKKTLVKALLARTRLQFENKSADVVP
ncbi:hypothetical protein MTO96_046877 [Rhipicephalus appendiculatus]